MTFYTIKLGTRYYMSRATFKAAYTIGDAELYCMIADKETTQFMALGICVYETTERVIDLVRARLDIELSDVDEMLNQFLSVPPDNAVEVFINEHLRVYSLGGIEFVRVMDMKDGGKYRLLKKLPSITYLGKRYIAVNVCKKGVKQPLVVRIGKKN